MKHKFAVLTILGALLALAVPASSSASISPASTKFEIANSAGPRVQTSLGSCALKITGETPKSPENATANLTFGIPTPTVYGCTSGTSATLSGEWKVNASGFNFTIYAQANPEAVTMRFSSLPFCKLAAGPQFAGSWSNGAYSPFPVMSSGYHAFLVRQFTWANDGGSCAVAGKTEPVSFYTGSNSATLQAVSTVPVNNLTSPTVPIIVAN